MVKFTQGHFSLVRRCYYILLNFVIVPSCGNMYCLLRTSKIWCENDGKKVKAILLQCDSIITRSYITSLAEIFYMWHIRENCMAHIWALNIFIICHVYGF